jgi:hypothetical protein
VDAAQTARLAGRPLRAGPGLPILSGPWRQKGLEAMTVPITLIPVGARVRIRRGQVPADGALLGRTGTVVDASEYAQARFGIALDGEVEIRVFGLDELDVLERDTLPPERVQARQRRALP